ncbi:MAG: putative porin [Pseudomonadota bacterium]|uniref:Putative general porin n=1 Tax=Gallaecimonas pentaromativorans TaxID=584787 RepID=A0A3N1NQ30_9GAMM|nr:putative porin [Gallaecimonas pentaromativorans]MED5526979.1 putative porin [Pseudomonadota bacterium]ROQ18295.1 putative general porin [Gallaecimonas pentaromativorans]
MKKAVVSLAILAAISAPTFAADSFQHEVNAGYSDHTDSDNADTWDLGYRYYLNSQSNEQYAYDLIPFLNHASWVEAAYANNDYVDAYGLGGRFVTQSDWVIEANYSRIDPDHASSDDVWGLGIGKYLAKGTLLRFNYANSDDADSYGLTLEHLVPVSGSEGLLLSASIDNTDPDYGDDVWTYAVGGDYFISRQWSVGADVNWNDGSEDYGWGLNTSYWFNSQANVKVTYADQEDVKGYAWGIQGTLRF